MITLIVIYLSEILIKNFIIMRRVLKDLLQLWKNYKIIDIDDIGKRNELARIGIEIERDLNIADLDTIPLFKLPETLGTDLASIAFIVNFTAIGLTNKNSSYFNIPDIFGEKNDMFILTLVLIADLIIIVTTIALRYNHNYEKYNNRLIKKIWSCQNLSNLLGGLCLALNYYLLISSLME
jgi:hypothetical protein